MDKIRILSRFSGNEKKPGEVTITNLASTEVEQVAGLINGQNWMCVENGRPKFRGVFAPLPDPITDEAMLPFWRKAEPKDGLLQEEMFDKERVHYPFAAHIVIQGLCASNYSSENYKAEAEKLESFGFIQMRSKRGPDGGYWELWFLPGTWAAKGALRDIVDEMKVRKWNDPDGTMKERETFRAVIEYLRTHVDFGSLEVSIQKLALVID